MPVLYDGKLYSWELAATEGQCFRCGARLEWEFVEMGVEATCCGRVVSLIPVQARVRVKDASP